MSQEAPDPQDPAAKLYSGEDAPNDGVCFTAGITGAPFAAGVIHAYLAADRRPPKVAAGISMGALSAAAMQRAYHELHDQKTAAGPHPDDQQKKSIERARWEWFRKYLAFLTDHPFDVIWNCIPDPSDFHADLPPVQEPDLPRDPAARPHEWQQRDLDARRALYMQVKLGTWLAHLPIKVSTVARLLVHYVRFRERYPRSRVLRGWNIMVLAFEALRLFCRLALHTARHPKFFSEWQFSVVDVDRHEERGHGFRPLFGWPVWLLSVLYASVLAAPLLQLLWLEWSHWGWPPAEIGWIAALKLKAAVAIDNPWFRRLVWCSAGMLFAPLLLGTAIMARRRVAQKLGNRIVAYIAGKLGIKQGLIEDFHLRLRLHRLFEQDGTVPLVDEDPMPVLLVSAPLQMFCSLDRDAQVQAGQPAGPTQLWPSTKGKVSIVDGLRAALALTPLLAPFRVEQKDVQHWMRAGSSAWPLDLVDGSVIRYNPLPALFSFFSTPAGENIAQQLSCRRPKNNGQQTDLTWRDPSDPAIRLVYNVPILPKGTPPLVPPNETQEEPPLPDAVDTARAGLRLERRRDTRIEVLRTNFITDIEQCIESSSDPLVVSGQPDKRPLPIHVDEIAPESEFKAENPLQPTETEILVQVAAGCRQTLGLLLQDQLHQVQTGLPVNCPRFLPGTVSKRDFKIGDFHVLPGLSEVCRHCTKELRAAAAPDVQLVAPSFDTCDKNFQAGSLVQRFPWLTEERPRVVFLLSGGVFRGSFHIGMLGALLAINLKPDMIVGASVGTLMGAALGTMFSEPSYQAAVDRLGRIALLFQQVDQRVALTKSLKSAARDFGIRGQMVHLDPNVLRKMMLRGAVADAGLAATGAPPALMDAISTLFMIPLNQTRSIAAQFVDGKIAAATYQFLEELKQTSLERLGIRDAVLGASLLEPEVDKMLKYQGVNLRMAQPFAGARIAFFATTSNNSVERTTVLGTDLEREQVSYAFVKSILASSAFPAVFAARRQSELYPGIGRRDIFFMDGGLFDNLPFVPALQVLGHIQADHARSFPGLSWQTLLRKRYDHPDLFLVGALNERVESDADPAYDTLLKVHNRASRLSNNEKIFGYVRSSRKIDRQIDRLLQSEPQLTASQQNLTNNIVNAAVLPVYPADKDHLNGTFAFCRTLALDSDRLRLSIADGCFQTLRELSDEPSNRNVLATRSVNSLRQSYKLAEVTRAKGSATNGNKQEGICPFFLTDADTNNAFARQEEMSGDGKHDSHPFVCPFFEASRNLSKQGKAPEAGELKRIWVACTKDPAHFKCFIKIGRRGVKMANENGGGTWSQVLRQVTISQVIFALLGVAVIFALFYGIYSAGGVFLKSLQDTEVARGLITFLVAFTTVTIGLILALYAIVSSSGPELKDRFGFGKEILTALIGILGTILGFYFGSSTQLAPREAPRTELSRSPALQVAPVFISNESPKKGDTIVLSSFVSSGKPPYTYSILFTPNIISQVPDRTSPDGAIKEEIKIPESIQKDTEFTFQIVIKDSSGKLATYDDKTKKFLVKAQ